MKIQKFNEVNINLGELDKTNRDGKLRGNVLIDKIKDHEDIIFNPSNGDKVEADVKNSDEIVNAISSDGEYDKEKAKRFFTSGSRYKKVIQVEKDDEDIRFQLNDIEKTEDFGSNSGSSLGTKETRNVECIQCLYLALRQTKGDEKLSEDCFTELFDIDGEIRKDLLENVKVPITINREIIENHLEGWLSTFVNTANALYEVKPAFSTDKIPDNVLSRRKTYIFYQIGFDGGLTKTITDTYRSFPETTGIPIAKWTPSDIWAINKSQHILISNRIKECKSIFELNSLVDSLFTSKTLRGISLKKLKDIEKIDDVKIVLNKVTPKPTYLFNRIITSTNPLGSLGIKIIADRISPIESENGEEVMDVRTFGGRDKASDISGEIIGKSARHGKVGLQRINIALSEIDPDISIPTKDELSYMSDSELRQQIDSMNQFIQREGEVRGTKGSIDSRVRLISKFQSLWLGKLLYENRDIADDLIQNIFYYAMAIQNDVFECPKYVRII
jgi:hypothetical protein